MSEETPVQTTLFVQHEAELEALPPGGPYARIQAGAEFCQELLPTPAELARLLWRCEELGLPLTLCTPLCTGAGIERVAALLALFCAAHPESEVVCNDWGVLRLLRRDYPRARPTLGRLIGRQRKDPRLWAASEGAGEGARRPSLEPAPTRALLTRLGVCRLELDLLPDARYPELSAVALPCAVHRGHGLLTLSRWCPVAGAEGVPRVAPSPCPRPCAAGELRLDHPEFPAGLALRGNALFYPVEPAQPPPPGVDRHLIHAAGLPR